MVEPPPSTTFSLREVLASTTTPETPAAVKVGAYLRCSTEEQAKEGYSIDTQRGLIEQFCKVRRWEVLEWFSDEGYSGAADWNKRPGLKGLLVAARAKKIQGVVAVDTDRLAREEYITAAIKKMLRDARVTLSFCRFVVDDSPASKFAQRVKEAADTLERDMIRTRTHENMDRAKSQGRWMGRVPWGHRIHDCGRLDHPVCGQEGKLEVEDPKVDEIKEMAEGGLSVAEMARVAGLPYDTVRVLIRRGVISQQQKG